MEITEIYSHTFWQKIRESNDFTKETTKELIWRNIFFSETELFIFPKVHSVEKREIIFHR